MLPAIIFADGTIRDVQTDSDGRPWVEGDDGDQVYGQWLHPIDGADEPNLVSKS